MQSPVRAVVVGGGISGLTTAYLLTRRLPGVTVTLVESDARPGGKVATRSLGGIPVETGPDALLLRGGPVRDLVVDLGLAGELSRTSGRPALVWTRGALRPLPAMSLFGVPDNPFALLRTGVLSLPGALRAGADLVLPRRRPTADPSIADLLRPRLGREVFDRLVEPMLGGVHAGRAAALSARSAVPEVFAAVSGNRSAYLALRERRRRMPQAARTPSPSGRASGRASGPVSGPAPTPDALPVGMVTFRGGLGTLVDALVAALAVAAPAAELRTGTAAVGVGRTDDGWQVDLADGGSLPADILVLATPGPVTAELLEPSAPNAAAALRAVPHVDVATVTLRYRRADLAEPMHATGFLVPPRDGRLVVGSTWTSAKWSHHDPEGEHVVIRCAVGRHGDTRFAALDDTTLVAAVHAELVAAMGLRGEPVEHLVRRWPAAMPQYTVGHGDRLAVVDRALTALPGLHVTGAAYSGVGLAGCITQADALVSRLVADRTSSRATQEVHP